MISENKKILSYLTGPSPKARPAPFGPTASPLEPNQAQRCSPPWIRQSAAAAAVSLACVPRRADSRAYLRRSTRTPCALPQLALPPCMGSRKAVARRPSEPCDTVELAAPIRNNGALTNEANATRGSAMPSHIQRASSRRRRYLGVCHGARTELQTAVCRAPESGRLLLRLPVVSTSLSSPSSLLSHVPPSRSPSCAGYWRLE
jgi:hypothetical protein